MTCGTARIEKRKVNPTRRTRLRIGVDATCWDNKRGYGRHSRALLSALVSLDRTNEYVLITDRPAEEVGLTLQVQVRCVPTSAPTITSASADGHRSMHDLWRMSRALSEARCDVLLFPSIYSFVPVFSPAKKIVFIHDVIPEKFPKLTQPSRVAHLLWQAKVALGRWQADAITTVSDYSQRQIVSEFGLEPERVWVVGEAADPIFRELEYPQPTLSLRGHAIDVRDPFIVYVGGFGPHKNLELLLRVFAEIGKEAQFANHRLILVGDYESDVFYSGYTTIRQRIQEMSIEDRVLFTGFVSDSDLVILLNLAQCLVLPSLMEGFGLPAVEAAACGCPVIATKESPLPGLLGEGGLYVDPTAEEDLFQALVQVLGSADLRAQMSRAGLKAARELTWEAAAHQMLQVIHAVNGE